MRVLLRIMRIKNALDPWISRPIQQVLTALLLERSEPWYLSDLAKRLSRTPSTLQRPLNALVAAGILRRWNEGNRVYFARNPHCPFLPELVSLLAKTAGLTDSLQEVLKKHKKHIAVAFVHGSIATGRARSESDVDLMIIGDLSLSELTPLLAKAEFRLGRPVNAMVFSLAEFSEKLAAKHHFLSAVMKRDKIFVQGTADELENLACPRKTRSTQHKQG
jgi:predicted nucleotidyltransferase